MAAAVTDVGTGAIFTLAGTTITSIVTSIGWSGASSDLKETTSLATTGTPTFMRGDLYDPGELSIGLQFNPDDQVATYLTNAAGEAKVAFAFSNGASGTKASWAASALITGFDFDVATEEILTGTLTVKLVGAITDVPQV